jgi:hypothetical protein
LQNETDSFANHQNESPNRHIVSLRNGLLAIVFLSDVGFVLAEHMCVKRLQQPSASVRNQTQSHVLFFGFLPNQFMQVDGRTIEQHNQKVSLGQVLGGSSQPTQRHRKHSSSDPSAFLSAEIHIERKLVAQVIQYFFGQKAFVADYDLRKQNLHLGIVANESNV